MGRKPVILQSEFPYNISGRCIDKEWFFLSMPEVWKIFCEELDRVCREQELVVHAFVVMSNHFHMVATTPRANISVCMHLFMHRTSLRLTKKANRINQTFGGRHYKSIMGSTISFLNACKYVYRNPVAAGICQQVEEYPYSSLQFTMGLEKCRFPLAEDSAYVFDPQGTLTWLNTEPDPEKLLAFKCGARRQYYVSKKRKDTNKPILGETELL